MAAPRPRRAGLAAAQQEPESPTSSTSTRDRDRETLTEQRPFRADLRLNSLFFENFFQAPEGRPQQDVDALAGELRLTGPLGPVEGYANLNYTTYDDPLEASQGVTAGVTVGLAELFGW
jgi:hypothetical protein